MTSRMTGPWPCLCLMTAMASPVGVPDGCTAPSWVTVEPDGRVGTMASAGRSTGPLTTGGAVDAVLVLVSSLPFLSFSGLGGAVVVGAGAAGPGLWLADGLAEAGAVVAVV